MQVHEAAPGPRAEDQLGRRARGRGSGGRRKGARFQEAGEVDGDVCAVLTGLVERVCAGQLVSIVMRPAATLSLNRSYMV